MKVSSICYRFFLAHRAGGLNAGHLCMMRGIFTSNQTFYVSASLQATAFVQYVCVKCNSCPALVKTLFHEVSEKFTLCKKKQKTKIGCLWPIPLLRNSCTSEAAALLRECSIKNWSTPEVIWVYVGSAQVLQIQMDISIYSFINDNIAMLKEAPTWRDASGSQKKQGTCTFKATSALFYGWVYIICNRGAAFEAEKSSFATILPCFCSFHQRLSLLF